MDIVERLRMKSNIIFLGERIAFGSECELMDEAAREITTLRQQVERLQEVKIEYELRMKEMRKEHYIQLRRLYDRPRSV
jgi:hypothetical protein